MLIHSCCLFLAASPKTELLGSIGAKTRKIIRGWYISQKLFDALLQQGLQLVTKIKKNMKNRLLTLWDKFLLRKRAVIESVNDQLKNISQIEHSRHRSIWNFLANILAALIAYMLQPKKPSIKLEMVPLVGADP